MLHVITGSHSFVRKVLNVHGGYDEGENSWMVVEQATKEGLEWVRSLKRIIKVRRMRSGCKGVDGGIDDYRHRRVVAVDYLVKKYP